MIRISSLAMALHTKSSFPRSRESRGVASVPWIPAFAGMTGLCARPLGLALTFSALSLAACGDSGGGSATRDSAGVTIVMSRSGAGWSAADRPKLTEIISIGGNAADSNYQFGAIGSVDIGEDGNFYVLDALAQVVRTFDSTGKFIRTIGRKGQGPGELNAASALFLTSGDTLLIADANVLSQSILRFGTDGSVRGAVNIQQSDGLSVKWVEGSNGTVVVQSRAVDLAQIAAAVRASRAGGASGSATAAPGGAPPVDRLIVRSASGTIVDTLMNLPGGQTMQIGGRGGFQTKLFAPEPMWTLSQEGGVLYGVNDEYSINVYDNNGVLKRIVRRDVERKPVTEEAKTALRAAMMKAMQDAMASRGMSPTPAMMDMMVSMIDFADYFPALGNLLGGPNGSLWVQQARSAEELIKLAETAEIRDLGSSKWDVYNKDGALLGEMQMPDDFTPLRFIGEKLVGVQSDANGTPRVAVMKVSGLCSNVEVAGKACI